MCGGGFDPVSMWQNTLNSLTFDKLKKPTPPGAPPTIAPPQEAKAPDLSAMYALNAQLYNRENTKLTGAQGVDPETLKLGFGNRLG